MDGYNLGSRRQTVYADLGFRVGRGCKSAAWSRRYHYSGYDTVVATYVRTTRPVL